MKDIHIGVLLSVILGNWAARNTFLEYASSVHRESHSFLSHFYTILFIMYKIEFLFPKNNIRTLQVTLVATVFDQFCFEYWSIDLVFTLDLLTWTPTVLIQAML